MRLAGGHTCSPGVQRLLVLFGGLFVVLGVVRVAVWYSTTATSSGSASSPSGQAMPTTAPAGYRQVVADDFTGSTLGGDWHPYSGQPGTDTGGGGTIRT